MSYNAKQRKKEKEIAKFNTTYPCEAPDGYMPQSEEEVKEREDTVAHIHRVREIMSLIGHQLQERAENHDLWKLSEKELPYFTKAKKLKGMTYGTEEYKEALKDLDKALPHHYSKYRHHPEFHENGIDDMTLVDLVEMSCDWLAASERHADGNIFDSINHNKKRFKMSKRLCRVFWNTARKCFGKRPGERELDE